MAFDGDFNKHMRIADGVIPPGTPPFVPHRFRPTPPRFDNTEAVVALGQLSVTCALLASTMYFCIPVAQAAGTLGENLYWMGVGAYCMAKAADFAFASANPMTKKKKAKTNIFRMCATSVMPMAQTLPRFIDLAARTGHYTHPRPR